jgi:peptidoglycan/LPS O-acetylase OafA/YrhL
MSANLLQTKPHYAILDGLRGVAAVMVVIFHICEAHSTSFLDMMMNHGYLAVDFFFLLSGFVIGYAYDDRWGNITIGEFFKRRLIRLQPMVVVGMIVGALLFYFQDSVMFPNISEVPVWQVILVMLIGCTMIALPPSMDIRGWMEMHPLNGPAWSLFFEYIGNILYALFIRKFSNTALAILVLLSAVFLFHLAVFGGTGDVIGGWALEPRQLHVGFARLLYPFFAGLLLSRVAKLTYVKNAFLWCSLIIIVVFSIPRLGDSENLWMNGLYDSLTVILIFPVVVYLGASGEVKGKFASRICKFLGDISYPIYITHYPIIYIYTGWVKDHNNIPLRDAWMVALPTFISAVTLAYLCLKFYDEPVRKWLTGKFIIGKKVVGKVVSR